MPAPANRRRQRNLCVWQHRVCNMASKSFRIRLLVQLVERQRAGKRTDIHWSTNPRMLDALKELQELSQVEPLGETTEIIVTDIGLQAYDAWKNRKPTNGRRRPH